MTQSIHKGTVLITGGARRIGRAIALRLAQSGWNVAIHCNTSKDEAQILRAALLEMGVRACVVQGDLSSVAQTQHVFEEARSQLGAVNAVVNNASDFRFDRGSAIDWAMWNAHMETNLRAPVQLAQLLHAQPEKEVPQCVVNLLDQKVFNLNPDFFSYTISKIALEGATRMLALELAPRTRVCAVAPGITLQSEHQSAENFSAAHQVSPLGYSSAPEDIADAVAFLLEAKAVTGTTLVVDGGQHLFPLRRDVMFEIGSEDQE